MIRIANTYCGHFTGQEKELLDAEVENWTFWNIDGEPNCYWARENAHPDGRLNEDSVDELVDKIRMVRRCYL